MMMAQLQWSPRNGSMPCQARTRQHPSGWTNGCCPMRLRGSTTPRQEAAASALGRPRTITAAAGAATDAALLDAVGGEVDASAEAPVTLSQRLRELSLAADSNPADGSSGSSSGASGGGSSGAGGGGSPAFCEPDTLSGLLQQFTLRQDGFEGGAQLDGLLAYYRRLGCSPAQLDAAVRRLAPEVKATAAVPGVAAPGGGMVGVELPKPGGGAWGDAAGAGAQLQVMAWELLGAAVAAAALTAWQSRPQGWSRKDLLEVRESGIAGRGVFATAPIPRGTTLGAYPGRLRTAQEMLAKCQDAPLAASYAFQTADGRYLDPTDIAGRPSPYPSPGPPWPLALDVTLAYVNEPPKGSIGTNAFVEDGPSRGSLVFVANRDIPQGAEITIDYGLSYDRSGYKR